MLSDEWLPRYRLLENFNIKWNRNWNGNAHGNAYDRGDYNSSFALRAVELKSWFSHETAQIFGGLNEPCLENCHAKQSLQPQKLAEGLTLFVFCGV